MNVLVIITMILNLLVFLCVAIIVIAERESESNKFKSLKERENLLSNRDKLSCQTIKELLEQLNVSYKTKKVKVKEVYTAINSKNEIEIMLRITNDIELTKLVNINEVVISNKSKE